MEIAASEAMDYRNFLAEFIETSDGSQFCRKAPKIYRKWRGRRKKFESLISNVSIMSIFAIKVGKLLHYPLRYI